MVYSPYRRSTATGHPAMAGDAGMSPREIEAAAFAMVNRSLREARSRHERVLALGRNHRLWSIIVNDAASDRCALPPILRDDILRLGLFSMKRSLRAMGAEQTVPARLIEINADMEAALRQSAATEVLPMPDMPVQAAVLAASVRATPHGQIARLPVRPAQGLATDLVHSRLA